MEQSHKDAISRANKGHRVSKETRKKIGNANRGIWIDYKCDFCRQANSEKQSHYLKSKRHFCGHKCYLKYREKILPPNEHNAWKGGITKITQIGRGGKKYKKWQQKVFKRDRFLCVWCGSNERLEADHIKRWSIYPKLRYKLSNGRTLCIKCHNKTRNKKFYENPKLLK